MASGLAARNGGWIGLAALIAIFLLGLGLRVGEAWEGRVPVYDAQAYAAIARNLDEGHGFTVGAGATQPSSNYSPGLPLFVGGVCEGEGGGGARRGRGGRGGGGGGWGGVCVCGWGGGGGGGNPPP